MGRAAAERLFSTPSHDLEIMSCWERFMADGPRTPLPVRDLIGESWRRCHSGEVDHRRYQAPPPVLGDQLHKLRDASHELVDASAAIMASARDFLAETGTVMVLTDAKGVVLNLEGDRSVSLTNAVEKIHLLPGADWSEATCGTNAIGTALETGTPIQVHSAEHFCFGIKEWSCSACVIRDPIDGTVIGVIDVSGLRTSYSRHSMALVVEAAKRIEARMSEIETENRYRLLERCFWEVPRSASDHVIIFDRKGRPVQANGEVREILRDLAGPDARTDEMRIAPDRDARPASGPGPHWMREEWLFPVCQGSERLGTVLTAPKSPIRASRTSRRSTPEQPRATTFDNVVGRAPAMVRAVARAARAAETKASVLILGETGVGKELFARSIHAASPVAEGPFVALNCGGLGPDLLSSELFGYGEGAFTGARRGGMVGKIEAATGGTLFLDEIGELPLALQPMFLRAIEEREICRLGETRPRPVDFRLVAATNVDLRRAVEEKRFRADLFYRVSVVNILVPPLRDRLSELDALVDHLSHQIARRLNIAHRPASTGLIRHLSRHDWPGNVRELRNVLEAMQISATGSVLTVEDLPPDFPSARPGSEGAAPGLGGLESAERVAIAQALRSHDGNVTAAARALGIAKSTLYAKMRRFGLERRAVPDAD